MREEKGSPRGRVLAKARPGDNTTTREYPHEPGKSPESIKSNNVVYTKIQRDQITIGEEIH